MDTKEVWVAIVPLKYEVIGVAATHDEAVMVAATYAYKELERLLCVRPETDSPEKVRDYFGVWAVRVPIGGAVTI